MSTKYLAQNRRLIGDFELLDIVDEQQIADLRGKLDVAAATSIRWNDWEYGSEVGELRALYEKGKAAQWNASTELDWSIPVSKDEWFGSKQVSMLANVLEMMGKPEAEQKAAMLDEIGYTCSQLLHGEQAALQLCGQLTALCPTTDEKLYAANQVADEARHVEIFARFCGEKLGTIHPVSPMLKFLLDELLSVESYHMKTLGMQTLFEGMAVGIMDMLRTECTHPLFVKMIRLAEQDEARHAAFGVLTMRRVVKQASPEQMAEMEDWAFAVLEAFNAAQQLDMLRTLGPKYGIDPEAVTQMLLALPDWAELNSMVFMHTVVPNLQRLGLISDRTREQWRERGMLRESRNAQAPLPTAGF